MGVIATYISFLFDPKKAYESALNKKVWTLVVPLIATILFTTLLNIYYYNNIDMAWLINQMVAGAPEQQRQSMIENLTKERLIGISMVGVVFLALAINLARAFIYWVILKIKGNSLRFIRLFAITMWSTVPVLLILPAGILNISLAINQQILPNDVNPVSLNQLLFHLPSSSPLGQLLSTFSLVNVWEIFLILVGLRLAAGLSLAQSFTIACFPDVLFYGIWIITILVA